MASNPMQRKTRNAFLGGFLIALIIGGIGMFFLYNQLQTVKKVQEEEEAILTSDVYVITNTVESGGRLNGNIEYKTITSDSVPSNAVTTADLAQYMVEDGATNFTVGDYLPDEIISKIKLEAGTILTTDMIAQNDGGVYKYTFAQQEDGTTKVDKIEKDSSVRLEEYNMIALPSKLEIGDYIDIRLQLPTGETFIVVSKKYVEDTDATTVWVKMAEEEILAMNNAIVEAYTMTGSKLYANIYVEAGNQEKASVTYVPSASVIDLINGDANIINTAREYLKEKYTGTMQSLRNDVINNNLNAYEEDRLKNTEEGITTEIESLRESRQKYLDELNAY